LNFGPPALHDIAAGKGDVISDAAGRTISRLPAQERWTTFALLDIERHALDAHIPGGVCCIPIPVGVY
jgi:hypothetical protein